MRRRQFLLSSLSAPALCALTPLAALAQAPDFLDLLTQEMEERARQPWQAQPQNLPEPFSTLGYDGYRQIQFDPARALWRGDTPFTLSGFARGWLHDDPVELFVRAEGESTPVAFTSQDFLFHAPLDRAPFDAVDPFPGIAGIKVNYPLNSPEIEDELLSFLGASYFRALGQGSSYGTSARGIAIDTAAGRPEEFPRFTRFHVVRPAAGDRQVTIYATLEGPSVTGAYRFITRPGPDTVMDVTVRLFFRHGVTRLGIAPLTSMFLYGGPNRTAFDDHRGRVHDSEGLKIIRQNGEEVWRNLNNPNELAASFYAEESPRAFGLMQRARDFADYSDAEAHYERRPSVLVEPREQWGKGYVCLIEIPTAREVNDNIVCFWIPESPVTAGSRHDFAYRLTWGDIREDDRRIARVASFAAGDAGTSGTDAVRGERKFVVDFAGSYIEHITDDASVEPVVTLANGEMIHSSLKRVSGEGFWRFVADVRNTSNDPLEISVHLGRDNRRLSETWSYQWRPGDDDAH